MKQWFLNLSVKNKLTYTFSVIMILLGITGGVGFFNLSIIYSNLQVFSSSHLPSINLLLQVDRDFQQALVAQRTYVFSNSNDEKLPAYKVKLLLTYSRQKIDG